MSFNTPILIVPSVYWASAAPQPSATAIAVRLISRFMRGILLVEACLFEARASACSDSEISVQLVDVGLQLGIGEPVDDAAIFHHVMAVRNRRGKAKVLLDQQDGEPLLLEGSDRPADLLDNDRREPLGRLIEEEQPRARAQDAADREHLLLAAGQLGSGAAQALLEVREQCEDALEIERLRPHLGWQQEVFLDIEARDNTAFLRAEGYS